MILHKLSNHPNRSDLRALISGIYARSDGSRPPVCVLLMSDDATSHVEQVLHEEHIRQKTMFCAV